VKAILTALVMGVLLVASTSMTQAQQGNEVIVYGHISPVRYEAVKGTGVFLGSMFNDGRWNVKVMNGAQELQGITADIGGFFEFRCPVGAYKNLHFIVLGGAAYSNTSIGIGSGRPGVQHLNFRMK